MEQDILDYLQLLCFLGHPIHSENLYRASHIILDYLQSLTPKYAHYTQKILHFLHKKNSISLIKFFKMIHSSKIF